MFLAAQSSPPWVAGTARRFPKMNEFAIKFPYKTDARPRISGQGLFWEAGAWHQQGPPSSSQDQAQPRRALPSSAHSSQSHPAVAKTRRNPGEPCPAQLSPAQASPGRAQAAQASPGSPGQPRQPRPSQARRFPKMKEFVIKFPYKTDARPRISGHWLFGETGPKGQIRKY